jgi:hypothetical protein
MGSEKVVYCVGRAISRGGLVQKVDTHGSVTRLGLASLLGEDDQSGLVLLQSVDVELLSLLRLGSSSSINGDTDALGLLPSDTSKLELLNGESSSL